MGNTEMAKTAKNMNKNAIFGLLHYLCSAMLLTISACSSVSTSVQCNHGRQYKLAEIQRELFREFHLLMFTDEGGHIMRVVSPTASSSSTETVKSALVVGAYYCLDLQRLDTPTVAHYDDPLVRNGRPIEMLTYRDVDTDRIETLWAKDTIRRELVYTSPGIVGLYYVQSK